MHRQTKTRIFGLLPRSVQLRGKGKILKENGSVLAVKICVRIEYENGGMCDIGFDNEREANRFILDIEGNDGIKNAYIFWPKCEVKNGKS